MKEALLLICLCSCLVLEASMVRLKDPSVLYKYVPSVAPTQVHVTYAGNKQYVFSWYSPSTSDPSSLIYSKVGSNKNNTQTGYAKSYVYEGYTSGGLHTVVLSDLDYSSKYVYTITGSASSTRTFTLSTVPTPGSENIIIGVMADVGADPNSADTINGLIKVRSNEGMDAVIHAGDLSYANNYNPGGPVWDQYGALLEPLASVTPYEMGVGNHEVVDNFVGYRLRYSVDEVVKPSNGGEFYYSVDIGLVHIIHLSSEVDSFNSQKTWIIKDLEAVNRKTTPWIIAIWHRPWYCTNKAHHLDGEDMRVALEDVFDKYKIDLVINGHVHAYERTTPILNFAKVSEGTEYLVVGNGGTPEGLAKNWLSKTDWSVVRDSEWGYGRFKFVNATHAHWSMWRDSDGTVLDDYWYIKNRSSK